MEELGSFVRWKINKCDDAAACRSEASGSILSPIFRAVGHRWKLEYYPMGSTDEAKTGGFVSMFLQLASTPNADFEDLTVAFDFTVVHNEEEVKKHLHWHIFTEQNEDWGLSKAFKRSKIDAILENSDCVAVTCCVYTEDCWSVDDSEIKPRRSADIIEHVADLQGNKEMMDAEFIVSGEIFTAHKMMLAARSPVFKAQFFGPLAETGSKAITIGDMSPLVFKAILHFIYTDELLEDDELVVHNMSDDGESTIDDISTLCGILAAADFYELKLLKSLCEEKLCHTIMADRVGSLVTLAMKHNSTKLKSLCIDFIVDAKNSSDLMVSDDYLHLVHTEPAILNEIRLRIKKNVK